MAKPTYKGSSTALSGTQYVRPASKRDQARVAADKKMLQREIDRRKQKPELTRFGGAQVKTGGAASPIVGAILGNAKKEAAGIVRGLPKAGYKLDRAFFENMRKGQNPIEAAAHAAFDPQVEYTKKKYSPLLPGGRPARETLEQIKKEPISTALDLLAVASAGAGTVGRGAAMARATGGPVSRVRASRTLPAPRNIRSGEAVVQLPASPSPVTRAMQRAYDRLSEAKDTHPMIPVPSARYRAAKQSAKQTRQDVRRRQAAFAQDINLVKDVPRQARPAAFVEHQLPTSARGGEGLQRTVADLRARAEQAAKAGNEHAAKRLSLQAQRIEKSAGVDFDRGALDAMTRLEAERARIFEDAGKLNPETAAAREGLLARKLGYEDTTGAGYIGHRTKEPPRSVQRLGQTRVASQTIGKTRTPPGINQQNQLRAYASGRLRLDPRVAIEDWQHGQRYEFQNLARKELAKFGEPIVERPKPGWYVLNPQGHKLPRAWKEHDPREAAKREGVDVGHVVEADLREYVQNTIAKGGTPEASALIAKAPKDVVQVPPEVVHRYFNQLEGRAGVGFGGASKLGKGADIANDVLRLGLIYSSPGYIPVNWIGNTGFALAHQGPFYLPGNLMRAGNVLRGKHGTELLHRLQAETGMGPTASIASEGTNIVTRGVRKVAQAEGVVADDPFRIAAWMHEARKAGYRSTKSQLELLRDAERGQARAKTVANELRFRVNDAMIDFERQGPMEKAVAQRVLFVWPWIRGATRYPFRFAADYPGRSALASHAALEAEADPKLKLKGRPDWLGQAFPASPVEHGLRKIINPRSASTVSTPLDVVSTIAGGITGSGGDASLLDLASPGIRLGADVATGRNRWGQRVGGAQAAWQDVSKMFPLLNTSRELVDPSQSAKIYGPQDRTEVLKRRLGRGVVPFQIDVKEAAQQADDFTPAQHSYRKAFEQRNLFYEEAKRVMPEALEGGKLPAKLRKAFNVEAERQSLYATLSHDVKAGTREYQFARYVADLELLRKHGVISRERGAAVLRTAKTASKEDLQKARQQISERYYQASDGPLHIIGYARKALKERGAKLD